MNIINQKTGWIEVICGSMFSGKTEELIRRIRRAEYARQKVIVFKPVMDDRYDENNIVSHSNMQAPSVPINEVSEIYTHIQEDTQIIAIDEAQFFDESIVGICNDLADQGYRVIVAGLDQDYKGTPFGSIPQLLAIAEYVTKNLAICMKCGNPANRTQRTVHQNGQILVGSTEAYEARCRNCHEVMD
ncbi:MAG: thymidine kinase [Candidatus Cloacimonadaceae bacterium]|nr:thymidine kinase [Candidatus Cloacimonadota bacterium]MDY0127113.1 thymidine kinase [Candidatus Cloacimonadaceae bacterium]MCB5255343.1 thymidine kinase [Candidatus Cloacimonadota bacterium]MCK9178986.1 thymidine kinase [Candidatus Cloacimonadota bacterium]MCK9242792.1 thymidine kinase [Candidatus Cloacimonadota bacterium]